MVCLSLGVSAQNVVTVSSGATYTYSTNESGQITSITNDNGTHDAYEYDAYGNIVGINVFAGNTVLNVRYVQGWSGPIVAAPGLPAVVMNADSNGRTSEVVVHPEISIGEGGEIEVEANGGWFNSPPPPFTAATLIYDTNGYLSQATLKGDLALHLTAPDSAGVVHQTLYGSTGNILAQANAFGSIPGIRHVPAYLDAVANEAGLSGQWADTLSFETSADGHVTIAVNSNSQPVLYIVNIGEIRVGFSAAGAALFYDVIPNYEAAVGTVNEGDSLDVAPQMAAVSPNHIVVTASGHTGFYMDHPADGAIYSAWNELNASGNETQPYATLDATSSSLKMHGSLDSKRLTARGNLLRLYRTIVCVGTYCWIRTWSSEWVEGGSGGGGGGAPAGYTAPPGAGGTPGSVPGNHVIGIPKAKVARAIPNAKDKLKDPRCLALLNQGDLYSLLNPSATRSLLWNMQARGFTDAGAYLDSLDFKLGMNSTDCPGGSDTKASTKPFSTIVHICPGFTNSTEGLAADYLIHEMLHSLGLPENPPTNGAMSSSQINDMVRAACGS